MDDKTDKMPMANEPEAITGSPEIAGENPESHLGMDTNPDAGSGTKDFSGPSFSNKRRKFIPIIAGAAAVVLIAAGSAAFALNQPAPESNDPASTTVEDVAPADDGNAKDDQFAGEGEAELIAAIDKFTYASSNDPLQIAGDSVEISPIVAHVIGLSDGVKDVDYYTVLDEEGAEGVKATIKYVKNETYKVEFINAFQSNGGMIKFDNEENDHWNVIGKIVETFRNESVVDTVEMITSERLSAQAKARASVVARGKVTQEDVDRVMEQLKEAIAKGDETLSGEKGQAVIDAATEYAGANPNVNAEASSEKAEKAGEGSATAANAAPESAGNGRATNVQAGSTGRGSSAETTKTPTPAPASDPKPTPAPKPQHTHSPNDVYRDETYVITPEQVTQVPYLIAEDGTKFYDILTGEGYCIDRDLSYSIYNEKNVIPAVTGTRSVYDHTECSTCGAWL